MSRLVAAAIALLSAVAILLGIGAAHRADRALDLWYCHAAVGYGKQAALDDCLASR